MEDPSPLFFAFHVRHRICPSAIYHKCRRDIFGQPQGIARRGQLRQSIPATCTEKVHYITRGNEGKPMVCLDTRKVGADVMCNAATMTIVYFPLKQGTVYYIYCPFSVISSFRCPALLSLIGCDPRKILFSS